MEDIQKFRLAVVSSFAAEICLLLLPLIEPRVLAGVALEAYDLNGLDAMFPISVWVWYLSKAGILLGLIGLFLLKKLGKQLFIAAVALSLALALVGGLAVGSAVSVTFGYVAALLQGAVLALSYLPTIASRMR